MTNETETAVKSRVRPFTCSICQNDFTDEWGNNAWPVNDGRCCYECDLKVVLPARIRLSKKRW
jgi:hypothetical protein